MNTNLVHVEMTHTYITNQGAVTENRSFDCIGQNAAVAEAIRIMKQGILINGEICRLTIGNIHIQIEYRWKKFITTQVS